MVPPKVAVEPRVMLLARLILAVLACKVPLLKVRAPVPSAVLLPTFKVPAEKVVPPSYVLALDKVKLPAPDLVTPKLLAPSVMTPESVKLPAPPIVLAPASVTAPDNELEPVLLVNAPLPPTPVPVMLTSSLPMAKPAISSVAPLATVVLLPEPVAPRAVALCALIVPVEIVVTPV